MTTKKTKTKAKAETKPKTKEKEFAYEENVELSPLMLAEGKSLHNVLAQVNFLLALEYYLLGDIVKVTLAENGKPAQFYRALLCFGEYLPQVRQ